MLSVVIKMIRYEIFSVFRFFIPTSHPAICLRITIHHQMKTYIILVRSTSTYPSTFSSKNDTQSKEYVSPSSFLPPRRIYGCGRQRSTTLGNPVQTITIKNKPLLLTINHAAQTHKLRRKGRVEIKMEKVPCQ